MLSVVVVAYNAAASIRECLESVLALASGEVELLLVDNASQDDTIELARQFRPRIFELDTNRGFSKAANVAARHATGEWLLFLNDDAFLQRNPLELIAGVREMPDVGAVGARCRDSQGNEKASCGAFPRAWRLHRWARMTPRREESAPFFAVDWVEGSFLLIRRALFAEVGGFDEDYFFYVEDMDLAKRLRDRGYICRVANGVYYTHDGGYTFGRLPMVLSGWRLWHRKHSSTLERVLSTVVLYFGLHLRFIAYKNGLAGRVEDPRVRQERLAAYKAALSDFTW